MTPLPRPPLRQQARSNRIVTALFASVFTLTLGSAASAAGLFDTVPDAAGAQAEGPAAPTAAIRSRIVAIDTDYLEANLVPAGIDRAGDRLRRAPEQSSAQIDLFDGVSVSLTRDSLKKATGGGYVWTGSLQGRDGFGTLVISGGRVTGYIQDGLDTYQITPLSGGLHRISEIDSNRFPGDIVVPPPYREPFGASPDDASDLSEPQGKTTVTVLIPYTKKARKESADIKGDANLAISLANTALKNSGVKLKYKLVGTMEVKKYKEAGDDLAGFRADLDNLATNKGKFKPVHKKRNKKKADLVAMLRKSSGTACGVGYFVETPTPADADFGFSVTTHNCVTNHSVAHEMGHNSGLEHDRYVVSPTPPSSEYNFGYVNLDARIRSIMAYNTQCGSTNPCTRVPMYSTPKKKYQGDKLGIKKGKTGAADAGRRLGETMRAISKYR